MASFWRHEVHSLSRRGVSEFLIIWTYDSGPNFNAFLSRFKGLNRREQSEASFRKFEVWSSDAETFLDLGEFIVMSDHSWLEFNTVRCRFKDTKR